VKVFGAERQDLPRNIGVGRLGHFNAIFTA